MGRPLGLLNTRIGGCRSLQSGFQLYPETNPREDSRKNFHWISFDRSSRRNGNSTIAPFFLHAELDEGQISSRIFGRSTDKLAGPVFRTAPEKKGAAFSLVGSYCLQTLDGRGRRIYLFGNVTPYNNGVFVWLGGTPSSLVIPGFWTVRVPF